MDLSLITKNTGMLLKQNSSTILTGLGVAGSIGSFVLAVKATPLAVRKLDVAYQDKNNALYDENGETELPAVPLTKIEVIRTVWKDYVPAVGLQVVTIGCIVGSQSINLRKQAALISAFGISEAALREYQERMAVETPTKDRKVRDDIARDKMENDPVSSKEVLLIGNGDQLFYESHTGRYFNSTMQKVQKAVNDLNFQVLNQDYASQNDFYNMIGLPTVTQGDEMGWTTEHKLDIDYSAQISDTDLPAVVLDYRRMPLTNYWKGFQ